MHNIPNNTTDMKLPALATDSALNVKVKGTQEMPVVNFHIPVKTSSKAFDKLIDKLYVISVTIPVKVLHDQGASNDLCEHVANDICNQFELISGDYNDFDDTLRTLEEEYGVSVGKLASEVGAGNDDLTTNFLLMLSTILLSMGDKRGYDKPMLEQYGKDILKELEHYKRGFLSDYELRTMLKKVTGFKVVREK